MVRAANFLLGLGTAGPRLRKSDTSDSPRRPPMDEHSMVSLLRSVDLPDGRSMPKGTEGAIVFIHGGGAAYMVEFDDPFPAVITVPAADLEQAPDE